MKLHSHRKKGFVLVLSLFLSTIVLTITLGMMNVLYKQLILSSTGRESQIAFYAADIGLECAFYWDFYAPGSNDSIFWASSSARASTTFVAPCASQDIIDGTGLNGFSVAPYGLAMSCTVAGTDETCVFNIVNIDNKACSKVTVTKKAIPTAQGYTTFLESRGRNRCSATDTRAVERAIEFRY
jgi:hypothetical protein